MKRIKFVGLDVHAETIAVAVAERGSENARGHSESIRKLVKKLGPVEQSVVLFESAYRQISLVVPKMA